MRIAFLDQQVGVREKSLDVETDPHECPPRILLAELGHALSGRLPQPEALHESRGDLIARVAHQVLGVGGEHIGLGGPAGAQLGGGAGVGEGL